MPSGTRGAPRPARTDPPEGLSRDQKRQLRELLISGTGATFQTWLDLEAPPALEKLQDLRIDQLDQALRMTRAKTIFGNDHAEMWVLLLTDYALADPEDCLVGDERLPDLTKTMTGRDVPPAKSRAIALRRIVSLVESARASVAEVPMLTDVSVSVPVDAAAFDECRGKKPFNQRQYEGDPDRLEADLVIAEGDYRLAITLLLEESGGDEAPSGRPFVSRSRMGDRNRDWPVARSLRDALGPTHCSHASGRWVANEGFVGPDAVVLECEDCLLSQIAVVPLHQMNPVTEHPVPELENLVRTAMDKLYLRSQAYYQAIDGDTRPIKSLIALNERDGWLSLDPGDYAVGEPPRATPPISVAAAMNRR